MTQCSPRQNRFFISVKNDTLNIHGHQTLTNKQLKQCFFQCLIQVKLKTLRVKLYEIYVGRIHILKNHTSKVDLNKERRYCY